MQYLLILLKTFIYYTICLLIIKLSGFNMRLLFVKQTNDGWPTKVVFEDKDIINCNIEERLMYH